LKRDFLTACISAQTDLTADTSDEVVLREEWRRNGSLDRRDGPALTVRNTRTDVTIQEQWWRGGELHRDDGPALIIRDADTGAPTLEQWWKNGQPFPPPAPAAKQPKQPL